MRQEASVDDTIAQIRDDNLKLVLAPQAYAMLAERERDIRSDARLAVVAILVFAGLATGLLVAELWTWLDWPGWSKTAGFLLSLTGLPAAIGTWCDFRADLAEVKAEANALDRFLTGYHRRPELARAEGLKQAQV